MRLPDGLNCVAGLGVRHPGFVAELRRYKNDKSLRQNGEGNCWLPLAAIYTLGMGFTSWDAEKFAHAVQLDQKVGADFKKLTEIFESEFGVASSDEANITEWRMAELHRALPPRVGIFLAHYDARRNPNYPIEEDEAEVHTHLLLDVRIQNGRTVFEVFDPETVLGGFRVLDAFEYRSGVWHEGTGSRYLHARPQGERFYNKPDDDDYGSIGWALFAGISEEEKNRVGCGPISMTNRLEERVKQGFRFTF